MLTEVGSRDDICVIVFSTEACSEKIFPIAQDIFFEAEFQRLAGARMHLIKAKALERECTVFTVNVDDKVYRCPVSAEALYMLCRGQDTQLDQVDAYLQLKMKVQLAVERLLEDGVDEMPGTLMPVHFIAY